MASWVQIANLGLRRLGSDRIASLTEDSEGARAVNDVYETVRDAVLRSHPWNCALVRASIAVDATAPAYGWTYAYTLPTDPYCLKPHRVGVYEEDHASIPHKVEGRKILTNETAPLKLLYISRVTDEEQFDPLLNFAMASAIAAQIAFRLTNSRTAESNMEKWHAAVMKQARTADAQEGTPESPVADDFLSSRL